MGRTSNSHSFLDNFTHSCDGGFGDFESKIMRIENIKRFSERVYDARSQRGDL